MALGGLARHNAGLTTERQSRKDKLAMTRQDRVTRGREATFMLGDGVHIFDQSTWLDFPQPITPCFRAEDVHRVLHRVLQRA